MGETCWDGDLNNFMVVFYYPIQMQKLTRLETITAERKEKETARKIYMKQSYQFAKRLWFIPYLIKLAFLTLFALFFYYLGYSDAPVCPLCDEPRPFIINLPATGAE